MMDSSNPIVAAKSGNTESGGVFTSNLFIFNLSPYVYIYPHMIILYHMKLFVSMRLHSWYNLFEGGVFMPLVNRSKVVFSIEIELDKKLRELSKETRINRSRLMDEAILDLLRKYGKPEGE